MNRRRCVLRRSTLRRIIVAAGCVLLVVPLTACQVELSTSLTVSDNGSGSMTVVARADAEAVAAAPELTNSLNLDDLRTAGWTVDVVPPTADSYLVVTLRRTFATPDEATLLLSQLSGENGPLRDLVLDRSGRTNDARYVFSGSAGLPAGLSGFADSDALALIGAAPFASSLATRGLAVEDVLGMSLTVTLPGKVESSNASSMAGAEDDVSTTFAWTIPMDESELMLTAATRNRDLSAMLAGYAAQGFLVLLILLVAGAVLYVATVAYRRKASTPAS